MKLLEPIVASAAQMAAIRRDLHAHPELCFEPRNGSLLEKPGCYVFIGNGDGSHRATGHGGGPCMLHNPSYDFNDALIPLGASYWVRLVEGWLRVA